MAQWSEKAIAERVAAKNAGIIEERIALFNTFRAGGWEIRVIDPMQDRTILKQTDIWFKPGIGAHFLVKMPGAYPMRIRTVEQLRRLANGVTR
jgi:hypothetical protein